MRKFIFLTDLGLAALIIIGTAQAQGTQNAPYNDGTPDAYCPPAGTVAEYNDGEIRTYHGPLPNRPSVCQSRIRKNEIVQSIFSMFGLLRSQGRIVEGEERVLADSEAFLPALFPLHVGARVRGVVRYSNNRVNISTTTITVLREERLTLPAGTFQAWVIQQEDTRINGAYERTLFWYDRVSGVVLKNQTLERRGFSGPRSPDYYAVRLSLPGEDPYAPPPAPH